MNVRKMSPLCESCAAIFSSLKSIFVDVRVIIVFFIYPQDTTQPPPPPPPRPQQCSMMHDIFKSNETSAPIYLTQLWSKEQRKGAKHFRNTMMTAKSTKDHNTHNKKRN